MVIGHVLARILLVLAAFVSLTGLHEVAGVVCALALAVLTLAARFLPKPLYERGFAACLGALLAIVPCLDSEILVVVSLVFFATAIVRRDAEPLQLLWAAPLVAYVLGSVLGELAIATDVAHLGAASFLRGVTIDGAPRIVDVWNALVQQHLRSAHWFARVTLLAILVSWFSRHDEARKAFVRGVCIGIPISALYAVAYWSGWNGFAIASQDQFWTSIHRVSGLLSDPNALGLVMGLGLWCLAWLMLSTPESLCWWIYPWVVIASFAGVVAGSRTFLLAVFMLLASLAWSRARYWFVGIVVALVSAMLIVSALDASTALLEAVTKNQRLPEGIKRGISALSLSRVNETFSSRVLFFEITRRVVTGHEVFGIGVDRFRDYVPYIGLRSGIVQGWTDNANNLYAGILAELGVVGFLFFLFVIAGRRLRQEGDGQFGRALVLSLAVLMFTGPHTDFPEALILVAFLLGATTESRRLSPRLWASLSCLGIVLGVFGSYTREQGVQQWKEHGGGVVRWLSNRARVVAECQSSPEGPTPQAHLTLKPVYIPQHGPLRLTILGADVPIRSVEWSSQEEQTIAIPCATPGTSTFVTITTQPPWSPYRAWPGSSGDRRLLGVQQVVRVNSSSGG